MTKKAKKELVPVETIGQRLKRLRLERGLSQREMSAPGVSYAYISRIEAGTRDPSVKALRKLAEKLDVTAEYLETGVEVSREELVARALIKGISETELFATSFVISALRSGPKPTELERQLQQDEVVAEKLRKEIDLLLLHYSAERLSIQRIRTLVEKELS